jgi:hypothetical protein
LEEEWRGFEGGAVLKLCGGFSSEITMTLRREVQIPEFILYIKLALMSLWSRNVRRH